MFTKGLMERLLTSLVSRKMKMLLTRRWLLLPSATPLSLECSPNTWYFPPRGGWTSRKRLHTQSLSILSSPASGAMLDLCYYKLHRLRSSVTAEQHWLRQWFSSSCFFFFFKALISLSSYRRFNRFLTSLNFYLKSVTNTMYLTVPGRELF